MQIRFKALSMIAVVPLLSLPALFAMEEVEESLPPVYETQESTQRFVERQGKFIVQVENNSNQDVMILVRSKSPFQKGVFSQMGSHAITLSGDWGKGTRNIRHILINMTPVYEGEFTTYRSVNQVIVLGGEKNFVTTADPNKPKYGKFNKLVVYKGGRAKIVALAETKTD